MTATGIVLAGGRSSRFGASKLDADLAGRTVLDWTIEAMRAVCEEVIVVGAAGGPTSGRRTPTRYLPDAAPFEGPLAGLATGLEAAAGDIALVIGGDMPLAVPDVLRLVIAGLDGSATAAILHDGVAQRPLPMAVDREAALVAATAAMRAGERSLWAFLGRLETVTVALARWRAVDPEGDTLLDVDTPAELEVARARLGRARG